ncbi:hypothetical protein ACS0TY_031309 [Phlomoides rotata]
MLSSNTISSSEYDYACSLFPPSPPHMHLEYQDVYLQFLHLFHDHPPAPAAAQDSTAKSASRSKKDRHSKINTARGPRDRRMRLSLDIATRFFRLQDLLGYDKASTTVNWLLTNAAPAIADLERHLNTEHDYSSEVQAEGSSSTKMMCSSSRKRRREKDTKKRVAVAVGRESRRKARERAKERTRQKRRLTPSDSEQHHFNPSPLFTYNNVPAPAPTFFTQDEQIAEFQFGGKPWEAFNSFHQ